MICISHILPPYFRYIFPGIAILSSAVTLPLIVVGTSISYNLMTISQFCLMIILLYALKFTPSQAFLYYLILPQIIFFTYHTPAVIFIIKYEHLYNRFNCSTILLFFYCLNLNRLQLPHPFQHSLA